MRKALFLACLFVGVLFSSCTKPKQTADKRHILTSHKWHYFSFGDDGAFIQLNHCDSNSYLIFDEGGNGGGANDDTFCNPTKGVFSSFTYTYAPDSNVIHVYNFAGHDFTWLVLQLDETTLEVQFLLPAPPPQAAHILDYIYKSGALK
ncbi:MAG: lipocalin family protein [Taibaiella sp.]|nr:lipocalin family protein [Taibaiella sp.]